MLKQVLKKKLGKPPKQNPAKMNRYFLATIKSDRKLLWRKSK